jgi:hypothetical protein
MMPDRLIEQAKVLADRVSGLSTAVEHLDQRTNRSERAVIVVTIILALCIILSIALGIAFIQLRSTALTVAETQERERITREETLCPFFSLVLGTYNPNSRAEGPARQTYIEQFEAMRRGYDALDCTGPLIPPPIPR